MFPPINVNKVKLSTCQRVVLMTHDKNTGAWLGERQCSGLHGCIFSVNRQNCQCMVLMTHHKNTSGWLLEKQCFGLLDCFVSVYRLNCQHVVLTR